MREQDNLQQYVETGEKPVGILTKAVRWENLHMNRCNRLGLKGSMRGSG